jgi:hypothetical protein
LQSATAILHIILAIMKEILSFGVRYNFVCSSKIEDFSIFFTKEKKIEEITWKLLGFKTMCKR